MRVLVEDADKHSCPTLPRSQRNQFVTPQKPVGHFGTRLPQNPTLPFRFREVSSRCAKNEGIRPDTLRQTATNSN
jgi:hypothetical protein